MSMGGEEIAKRFNHHPPTEDKVVLHEATRFEIKRAASSLDNILPDSREKSLAMTALEEALMWANAAIARNPDPNV